jgi:hypothetical protein
LGKHLEVFPKTFRSFLKTFRCFFRVFILLIKQEHLRSLPRLSSLCQCQPYSQCDQNTCGEAPEQLSVLRAAGEPRSNGPGRISNRKQEAQTKEGKGQAQEDHL